MPYSAIGELPDSTKALPAGAKEIYMKAFNAAFEQYKDRGGQREALAHATAWTAVERVFKKNAGGDWVAREATGDLSAESKKEMLQKSLITYYGLPVEESPKPGKIIIE